MLNTDIKSCSFVHLLVVLDAMYKADIEKDAETFHNFGQVP